MSLAQSIQTISNRWPKLRSPSDASPVFIMAAGWRSGSTLLQRMMMKHCFVWGEPFGRAAMIDALSKPLEVFNEKWPPDGAFVQAKTAEGGQMGQKWVANLYPPMPALLTAQVNYFRTLFEAPAKQLGYSRWGLKDVRLTGEHAAYLKWVFPNAKLLFLYRNPYDCYRSFQALKLTYVRWPDEAVNSPETFGRHWTRLTQSFFRSYQEIGGMLIKYEDLCGPSFNISNLNNYLGFEVDTAARDKKVGSSEGAAVAEPAEIERLQKVVGAYASTLNYQP